MRAADASIDVILLTPSIHNSAYYLNVFAHGESKHPGLLDVAQQFFQRLGKPADLGQLVTDSRTEVFSNYFVARPRFWREWLKVNEAIFAIAEDPHDALGARLRAPAPYRARASAPMKIFVMERIATWILNTDGSFHATVCDPFAAASKIHRTPLAVVSDALKIAYVTQRRGQYLDVFQLVQAMRRGITLHIRLGALSGYAPLRQCLKRLAAYWNHDERS